MKNGGEGLALPPDAQYVNDPNGRVSKAQKCEINRAIKNTAGNKKMFACIFFENNP